MVDLMAKPVLVEKLERTQNSGGDGGNWGLRGRLPWKIATF